jgi:ammonia channel protein AmtB
MGEQWQPTSRDRALARWAGACLGGSALIGIALLLLAWFAANPGSAITTHPIAVAAAFVAAGAYILSLMALGRLARRHTTMEPRRLWRVSLLCNLAILAIVVMALGAEIGLAICVMELVAIAVHVIAIAMPAAPTYDA